MLSTVRRGAMNKINPRKLLHSKWTAQKPQAKEKHFMITDVEFDEEGIVTSCLIEAVMTKGSMPIEWQDLKNIDIWQHGWT
jgi:tryptophan-rich hypothetical protein